MELSNESRRNMHKARTMFTSEEIRQRRVTDQVEIRKQKKDERLTKRRYACTRTASGIIESDKAQQAVMEQTETAGLEEIRSLQQDLYAAKDHHQLYYICQFKKVLSRTDNLPIDQVISLGIVPYFVCLLDSPLQQIQASEFYEVACMLTNIAAGESHHVQCVIEAGGVQAFIRLLGSPFANIVEQSLWALGNIAGDNAQCRDYCLEQGVLPPLLAVFEKNTKLSLIRNTVWALSNLCRGDDPQPDWRLVAPALPALAHLMTMECEDVLIEACWATAYLSDGNHDRIQAVLDTGLHAQLIELINHPSLLVRSPAVRTIGNIVTGDKAQTQAILDCHGLGALARALSHTTEESFCKDVCWAISNITAGDTLQVQTVIDAGVIPLLVDAIKTGDFLTKKEACWAICNVVSKDTCRLAQVHTLVQEEALVALCSLLECHDMSLCRVVLEGIESILCMGRSEESLDQHPFVLAVEECKGVDSLYRLQLQDNSDIAGRASYLLDTYFETGTDTDAGRTDLASDTGPGASHFTFQPTPYQGGFEFHH
ncbi:armadillo-type protein [Spinellus fusiger]|nr:armadillo-type protein [Spinellus fusiger]